MENSRRSYHVSRTKACASIAVGESALSLGWYSAVNLLRSKIDRDGKMMLTVDSMLDACRLQLMTHGDIFMMAIRWDGDTARCFRAVGVNVREHSEMRAPRRLKSLPASISRLYGSRQRYVDATGQCRLNSRHRRRWIIISGLRDA